MATRIVLERVLPPLHEREPHLDLPPIASFADIVLALAWIFQNVAYGKITSRKGDTLCKILNLKSQEMALVEFEARISALERSQAEQETEEDLRSGTTKRA